MRRVVALAAGALSLAVLAFPAFASHTVQRDANDVDGRLDVREVDFDHFPGPLEWRFTTFGSWTIRELWDRGYLVVELDTRGDERIDLRAVVRSDGRRLLASLFRVRIDGSAVEIGDLRAEKRGGRGASVRVDEDDLPLGRHRTSYLWSATSVYAGASCARTCIDRVPDRGMVEHVLPTPTPTPTPTPSPTP